MTFEDVNVYERKGYYIVPNEDTVQWRTLVKGLRVDKAAAICSSGEVGLFAMLPTVRKELVLIDHSYASLSVAMLKYIMLRELGATETRRLLTAAGTVEDLTKNLKSFVAKLPKEVRDQYEKQVQRFGSYEGDFVIDKTPVEYDYDNIDPKTGYYKIKVPKNPNPSVNSKLRREWDRLPQRDVLRCTAKLDKVKFLHGDLNDLAQRGPFDLLYLSNALDHSGRNGRPECAQVAACVKPGGYIIMAHRGPATEPDRTLTRYTNLASLAQRTKKAGWEVVSSVRGGVGMIWWQTLYQLPIKQEVAA